jgi:hypothetical protein
MWGVTEAGKTHRFRVQPSGGLAAMARGNGPKGPVSTSGTAAVAGASAGG